MVLFFKEIDFLPLECGRSVWRCLARTLARLGLPVGYSQVQPLNESRGLSFRESRVKYVGQGDGISKGSACTFVSVGLSGWSCLKNKNLPMSRDGTDLPETSFSVCELNGFLLKDFSSFKGI